MTRQTPREGRLPAVFSVSVFFTVFVMASPAVVADYLQIHQIAVGVALAALLLWAGAMDRFKFSTTLQQQCFLGFIVFAWMFFVSKALFYESFIYLNDAVKFLILGLLVHVLATNDDLFDDFLRFTVDALIVGGLFNAAALLAYIYSPPLVHGIASEFEAFGRQYLSIGGLINAVWFEPSAHAARFSLFWDEPGQLTLIFWFVLGLYIQRYQRLDIRALLLAVLPTVSLSFAAIFAGLFGVLVFAFFAKSVLAMIIVVAGGFSIWLIDVMNFYVLQRFVLRRIASVLDGKEHTVSSLEGSGSVLNRFLYSDRAFDVFTQHPVFGGPVGHEAIGSANITDLFSRYGLFGILVFFSLCYFAAVSIRQRLPIMMLLLMIIGLIVQRPTMFSAATFCTYFLLVLKAHENTAVDSHYRLRQP